MNVLSIAMFRSAAGKSDFETSLPNAPPLIRFERENFYLDSPISFVVLGVAWVCRGRQRIVPAVAHYFEFVRVELVFVHDGFSHGIGAIIRKLTHQVGGHDAFPAGVRISLNDDIGIAKP